MTNNQLENVLMRLKELEAEIQALKEPEDFTYKGFNVQRVEDKFVVTINGKNLFSEKSLENMHYRIDEFYRESKWTDIGIERKVCVWRNWTFVWARNTFETFHHEHTVYCWPADILPAIVKDLKK